MCAAYTYYYRLSALEVKGTAAQPSMETLMQHGDFPVAFTCNKTPPETIQ